MNNDKNCNMKKFWSMIYYFVMYVVIKLSNSTTRLNPETSRPQMEFLFWSRCCNNSNFGDLISPYIYAKITGKKAVMSGITKNPGDVIHFGAGSILQCCRSNKTVVWGTGVMTPNDRFKKPMKILSVRGPITRKRCLELGYDCPEVYGDTGLILPLFYAPHQPLKKYSVGIIPHYVDFDFCKKLFGKNLEVMIVDIRSGVEGVVDQIIQCKVTLSTSLHGLIASHAYQIRSAWIQMSNKIAGKGTKYRDYYQSLNMFDVKNAVEISSRTSTEDLIQIVEKFPNPTFPIPTEHIVDLCPYSGFKKFISNQGV